MTLVPETTATPPDTNPVESNPAPIPTHTPDPLLYLLRLLLPPLTLPPLLRLLRLPPPPLRPPHPELSLQPPRPHNPNPFRPAALPQHSSPHLPQRTSRPLPTQRSPNSRLEQIPLHHHRNRGRRPSNPNFRHTCPQRWARYHTAGPRVRGQTSGVVSTSIGHVAECEL